MNFLPKFKSFHPVFEVKPGLIRLGEVTGMAVEIEDESGSVMQLIKSMDGTRTCKQIYEELVHKHPTITYEEVCVAIDDLNQLGFVSDHAFENQTRLTDLQKERYAANVRYFSHFTEMKESPYMVQERLHSSKVTILGSGAYGSSILLNLAGLGVHNIRLVDFDRVELSNLNRQFLFKEDDIGHLKTEVASHFIEKFNSNVQVETLHMQIRSLEDVRKAIIESDLVILAADKPFVVLQRWVNKACVEMNIPFIGGGLNLTEGTLLSIIPKKTGCIDCLHLYRTKLAPDYPDITENLLKSNFSVPTATTISSIMIMTGMVSTEAMKFITGLAEVESAGKMIKLDLITFEKKVAFEWEREHQNCPTCGFGSNEQPIFQTMQRLENMNQEPVPK